MNGLMMPLSIGTLMLAIIAFGGMLYNFQSADDIGFHTHPTHITTPHTEAFDDSDVLKAITQLETKVDEQRAEYTREIVQTRKLLQDAQIGTGDKERDELDEQTGSGTSPRLTIHLDSNEFLRGEIIWISRTADPLKQVEATITDPNLSKRHPNASIDRNGSFKIGYTTDFESALGTYTVYVRSQGEISQTLSFVLKE